MLLCLLAQVRFAAVKVIEEMVRQLGDSYKVVLPETIVTLTELNEGETVFYTVCCLVSHSGTHADHPVVSVQFSLVPSSAHPLAVLESCSLRLFFQISLPQVLCSASSSVQGWHEYQRYTPCLKKNCANLSFALFLSNINRFQ